MDAATYICLPGELYLSYHFGGPACGYRQLHGAVSLLLTAASHPGEVSPLLGPLGLGPPLSHVDRVCCMRSGSNTNLFVDHLIVCWF